MKLSSIYTTLQDVVNDIQSKYRNQLDDFFATENMKVIEIHNIRVKDEFQNKGIGTDVLNMLKEYSKACNKPIVLTAEADNRKKGRLKEFYKSNDFKKPGRRMNYSYPHHSHIWRPN